MNPRSIFLFFIAVICGVPAQNFSLQGRNQTASQKPSVVAKGPLGTVTTCVAAAGDVYWLEEDTKILYTNRETGGYPGLLLRTNTVIQNLAADSDGVYYVSENKFEAAENQSDSILQGELRATGKKRPITTLRQNLRLDKTTFIGPDSTDIYLLTIDEKESGAVLRIPKNGTPPQFVGDRVRFSAGSAVMDAGNVYWLHLGFRTLNMLAKSGGAPKVIFTSEDPNFEPLMMAIDDNHLYLVTRETQILQIDKLGGKSRVLYPGKGVEVFGPHLTVDGGYLYWIENNNIMRMKSIGGTATSIAQAESPTCLTVDDKYVFWFEAKGLVKIPK